MLSVLLIQCLRVKLMHKNWVWKGYDQSVNLHVPLMKMIHTQLLIVLIVTLRSIYCKQAIVTTHKQSLKRSESTIKTIRKASKPRKYSCNIKWFLTVPKLYVFGLIRNVRSRASISKKNQLNRGYETQVTNKRSLNTNLFKFKF